ETLDQPLADLPGIRRLVPAVDLREFPRERAVFTARAPVFEIVHRVQADRPHGPGQDAAHDGGERCNPAFSSAHPGPIAVSVLISAPARLAPLWSEPRCR